MNCPSCNENKEQRDFYEKYKRCGCCNGERKVTFHRYVQYSLGDVCWLNSSGTSDSSPNEMSRRCESIIESCYSKYNKKGRPNIYHYSGHGSPQDVMWFYAKQFY